MTDDVEAIAITRTEQGLHGHFPSVAEFSPECFRYAPQLGIRLTIADDYGNEAVYRITGFTPELNLKLEKEDGEADQAHEKAG